MINEAKEKDLSAMNNFYKRKYMGERLFKATNELINEKNKSCEDAYKLYSLENITIIHDERVIKVIRELFKLLEKIINYVNIFN